MHQRVGLNDDLDLDPRCQLGSQRLYARPRSLVGQIQGVSNGWNGLSDGKEALMLEVEGSTSSPVF